MDGEKNGTSTMCMYTPKTLQEVKKKLDVPQAAEYRTHDFSDCLFLAESKAVRY